MKGYTTEFCFTLEEATVATNAWIKILDREIVVKEYITCVKGEPMLPNYPEYCWAITNRFDPDIRKEQN